MRAHRGAHLRLQIGEVLGKRHWNLPMPVLRRATL
jgi:hypothetical protein